VSHVQTLVLQLHVAVKIADDGLYFSSIFCLSTIGVLRDSEDLRAW
jgi:hypothetical protein